MNKKNTTARGDVTRQKILEAGLKIWHYDPAKLSTRSIAKVIDCEHTTVWHHYPHGNLRKAVALYGISQGDSVVISTLILTNDKLVRKMPEAERKKHLKAVAAHKPKKL